MRALIAPDKFKGTFTASDVADAIANGFPPGSADVCPIADGGDGTASVLVERLGGQWFEAAAHDALGRPIRGHYAVLTDGTAVVEVSEASGLARLEDVPSDGCTATSIGTGELIADAITRGARRILVACGGSATTDAGLGALSVLEPLAVEIVCLCDISERFIGAIEYAPQKGAREEDLPILRERLERAAEELPRDPRTVVRSGAAGGLAGGFWAHGAKLVSGAGYVLDALQFDARLRGASMVVTGEGRLDFTSLHGKAVAEVAKRARAEGVPLHAIVGSSQTAEAVCAELGIRSVQHAGDLDAMARGGRALAAEGSPEESKR